MSYTIGRRRAHLDTRRPKHPIMDVHRGVDAPAWNVTRRSAQTQGPRVARTVARRQRMLSYCGKRRARAQASAPKAALNGSSQGSKFRH